MPLMHALSQVPVEELDVGYYLPLFFDGLVEVEFPYEFIARKGVFDLLEAASPKLLQLLPTLIPPLRRLLPSLSISLFFPARRSLVTPRHFSGAMNSRDPEVMKTALKVIQKMATSSDTGPGLVPYYRHFLPPLNLFIYRDRKFIVTWTKLNDMSKIFFVKRECEGVSPWQ